MPVSLTLSRLDRPAVPLGVAGVHPEQLGREQRRLLAAGAGADLDDDVPVVVRVARQQQDAQRLEQARLVAPRARRPPRAPSRASPGRLRGRGSRAPSSWARTRRAAVGSRRRRARAAPARARALRLRVGVGGDLGSRPSRPRCSSSCALDLVEAVLEAHCVRWSVAVRAYADLAGIGPPLRVEAARRAHPRRSRPAPRASRRWRPRSSSRRAAWS